jgi:hypothetical protein
VNIERNSCNLSSSFAQLFDTRRFCATFSRNQEEKQGAPQEANRQQHNTHKTSNTMESFALFLQFSCAQRRLSAARKSQFLSCNLGEFGAKAEQSKCKGAYAK